MKTFLLTFLGGLAALVVFFVLLPLVLLMSFLPSGEPPRAHNAVLELDLRGSWPDQPPGDPIRAAFSDTSFVDILLRLNAAIDDPEVKGVFVRAAESDLGSSRAEELRAAFLRLKAKGKVIIAHSQGFLASGPAAYRAISVADQIWLQPGTSFEVPGIAFETMFLGGAMQKYKVDPEIEQFYEFKNAADTYKQKGYTPAHAESMTALASSVWTHSIADIAADRKVAPDAMKTLLEASPYTAEKALELKLVDKLGWPEEAATEAEKLAGGKLLKIASYHPAPRNGKKNVVIIGGEGDIVTGDGGGVDVLNLGSATFASDRISRQLLDLADDKTVDAVIFRIDSGGGSATASDQIWNAVEQLKKAGKKVVVSMGAVAASGGYYVAAGADAIVANRSTITGSIGVFGGKFAVADALREFGINPADVHVGGDFATAYSTEKFTPKQRAKLIESLQAVYDRFTGLVAQGRKLPLQTVQAIARGRVWSGEDALKNKLVDRNGDLITAIDVAHDLLGLKPDEHVRIVLPRETSTPLGLVTGTLFGSKIAMDSPQAKLLESLVAVIGRQRAEALASSLRQLTEPMSARVWSPPVVEH